MTKYRIVKKQTSVWPFTIYDVEAYYEQMSVGCENELRQPGWQVVPKNSFEYHRYTGYIEAFAALDDMNKVSKNKENEVLFETEF